MVAFRSLRSGVKRSPPSPASSASTPHDNLNTVAIGRAAERRVAEHLRDRGYVILGVNVRVGRDELDLVALEGRTVVIVEVRARGSDSHGHAFETITRAKAARLRRAAARYLAAHDADAVRIDVAAVTSAGLEIIENAIDFTVT
jgi:putative endonuclease